MVDVLHRTELILEVFSDCRSNRSLRDIPPPIWQIFSVTSGCLDRSRLEVSILRSKHERARARRLGLALSPLICLYNVYSTN
jgi:hypothetical protein